MPKSLIEKYQKLLEDDPKDPVFIELAKALIEKGEHGKAADVCSRGVSHHPESVVGRVLWGKALLGCSRPAEAMEQFDKATAINRDDPFAYNLIGEVLLHKGLFRSAIPILKKAVALQPSDARVKQWLDQAIRGSTGAPPPEVRDSTAVDAQPADHAVVQADPTLVEMRAYQPVETVSGITDVFKSLAAREAEQGAGEPMTEPGPVAAVPPAPSPGAELLPFDPPTSPGPVPAATATVPEMPAVAAPAAGGPAEDPVLRNLTPEQRKALEKVDPEITDVTGIPEAAAQAAQAQAAAPAEAPMEVSAEDVEPVPAAPAKAAPAVPPLPRKPGLLADLPEAPPDPASMPSISMEIPSVLLAPDAAEDIAREYERELRERLLAAPPPTWWRKNWLQLAAAGIAVVVLLAAALIYVSVRRQNQGRDLTDLRTQAYRALALATPTGYRDAIDLADRVLAIASGDEDAKAAQAFASASLYHRFEQDAVLKAAASGQLQAGSKGHPGLALAVPYYLADDAAGLEAAKKAILEAAPEQLPEGFEGAEVLSIAGRMLMSGGKVEDALARFKAALDTDPAHVDTLVALGSYYLSQGEPEQAEKFFGLAKQASPAHVPALLGAVNAALELDRGEEATADLQKTRESFSSGPGAWPASMRADLDLAEGRVLGASGRFAEGSAKLSAGAFQHTSRAADFYSALGAVEVLAGNHDKAELAFEKAVAQRPNDAGLREELARAMIAQGRHADALRVTEGAFADDRRLRIVRGLARLEMGQLGKAREELTATFRKGKVPTEAAIYLALIDLEQGQHDTARQVLENAVKAANGRGLAHAALGRLYLEEGKEEAARAEFLAAANDKRDWEGACALGRMELRAGHFAEARQRLESALSRNKSHAEARVALGQALLALGDLSRAHAELAEAQAKGATPAGHRGMARVLAAQGDLPAARKQLQLSQRLEPANPDNARLAGELALLAGDAASAVRSLERAAKADPKNPLGYCEVGEAHLKAGNPVAARKAFEAAQRQDRAHLRARLGLVASSLPGGAKAVQAESEALVKETASGPAAAKARALALNARVLLALGEREKARDRARAAVAASDASADAHLALGLVAQAAKEQELALKELQRASVLDPAMAEAHLALGVSLAREASRTEEALAAVQAYLRIAPKGPDAASARKVEAALQKKAASER